MFHSFINHKTSSSHRSKIFHKQILVHVSRRPTIDHQEKKVVSPCTLGETSNLCSEKAWAGHASDERSLSDDTLNRRSIGKSWNHSQCRCLTSSFECNAIMTLDRSTSWHSDNTRFDDCTRYDQGTWYDRWYTSGSTWYR